METLNIALLGFGNVGKAFVRLLVEKRQDLLDRYDLEERVTGIMTNRHGACLDPNGLDVKHLIELMDGGQDYDLEALDRLDFRGDSSDFIRLCNADVLIETTPVNPKTGQPALGYLKEAALNGMHIITANKGTVVFGFRELTELTRQHERCFRFESAVMDGAPIFSLFRNSLAGAKLLGFYGILNSCTNLLLDRMRAGETLDEAIAYGTSIGITETDPSNDVDGWDAAIKVAALSNVLMGRNLTPIDVNPTGIRGITPEMIKTAEAQERRWKLVCQAGWKGNEFFAQVAPEMIGPDSPLYTVSGTSSYVSFELDVLPGLGILETDPTPATTAFGLLADLIDIHSRRQK